jgi:hypothetical protein
MTSEIVRFMNQYISDESKRFKSYQIESKEINDLKKIQSDRFPIKTQETTDDSLATTWIKGYSWEDSYE